jgi:hypothetical protein
MKTWLHSDVLTSKLSFSCCDVFHCDRSFLTSNLSRDGGVLTAVKSSSRSLSMHINTLHVEHLLVRILLRSTCAPFAVVYFPPRSSPFVYSDISHGVIEIVDLYPDRMYNTVHTR